MRSIVDIVAFINSRLCNVIPGMKLYNIAQIVSREAATVPVVDEKDAAFDDTHPAQIYHKINGLTMATTATGFGRDNNLLYTYQMSMIVFLNKRHIRPEDFPIIAQGNIPQRFTTENTQSVSIKFLSAILNDQQVFAQEYRSPFRLGTNQRLFQINYSLEVVYKPGCFEKCPEEINCKN